MHHGIFMNKGRIETFGKIEDVAFKYTSLASQNIASSIKLKKNPTGSSFILLAFRIMG
jgi:hypothetical protein